MSQPRIIISGGGTGGHIYPAIAIAQAIQKIEPEAEILFVGAEGRMEMEKVPEAGYKIIGLRIAGLQRRLTLKNLSFPFKLAGSLIKARKIVSDFKPDVAVGVGGYASGPLLRAAAWKNVPVVIQEQNSYPGITNKLLGKAASAICVAYDGMEKFFPSSKIKHTGNPVRSGFDGLDALRDEAIEFFGLGRSKRTILAIGGSLGARTINESLAAMLDQFPGDGDTQLIWQTGKNGVSISEAALKGDESVKALPFISRMDLAYAAADVIISRAGAMSISELCLVGKPVILIPSPNVAEDHQTKNAMALVDKGAAILVKDNEAKKELRTVLQDLIANETKQKELSASIKKMALPDASDTIAREVLSQMRKR